MRVKTYLKNILYLGTIIFLFISFLTLTYIAVVRYLRKDTSYHVSFEDKKSILYPSVSICKRYAFDTADEVPALSFENKSIEDVIEMVLNNSWNIDDQFYFFTHPGIMNLTFPCTTTLGGTSQGKPCVFPIIDEDGIEDKCKTSAHYTKQPSCFTKIGENNEYNEDEFADNWGYCPANCN